MLSLEELADFWRVGVPVEAEVVPDDELRRAVAEERAQWAFSDSCMGTAETYWRLVGANPGLALLLLICVGCSDPASKPCSVADNGDGTSTISCPDGTSTTLHDGADGTNGANGANGTSAQQPLVRLDPAGADCANGGTAVKVGLDTNGNGILDDTEVTSTTYLCNPGGDGGVGSTVQGSFLIRNSIDAGLLGGVTHITGDLIVDAPGLTSLALPTVAVVDGNLTIAGNPTLATVALPALTTVGGTLAVNDNQALTGISLPALTTGDALVFAANPTLATIDLAALTTAETLRLDGVAVTTVALPKLTHGAVALIDLTDLTTIDLPLLTSGALELEGLPGITTVSIPSLITPNRISIRSTALTNLDAFAAITSLGAELVIASNPELTDASGLSAAITSAGSLSMQGNPKLTSIDFPLLTTLGGALTITGGALTHVGLPQLTTAGPIDVSSNPALTSLSLPELTTASGALSVRSNAVLATVSLPKLAGNLTSITMINNAPGASVNLDGLTGIGCYLVVAYYDSGCTPDASKSVAGQVRLGAYQETLGTVSLGGLTQVYGVSVEGNVSSLVLDNLVSITTYAAFQQNSTLTTLSLPMLTTVGQGFTIDHFSELTTLSAPLLTSVGQAFNVSYNAKLPTCAAQAIYDRLSPKPPYSDLSNNNSIGTCN